MLPQFYLSHLVLRPGCSWVFWLHIHSLLVYFPHDYSSRRGLTGLTLGGNFLLLLLPLGVLSMLYPSCIKHCMYSCVALMVKNLPANAESIKDAGSRPGSGISPGEGHGNPFQYSCLRIPWTEEPGGLQSTGSHTVKHDWSDLACTQAWGYLLVSYYVLCSLYILSYWTFPKILQGRYYEPILQMRKLRLRQMEQIAQEHTARNWQGWESRQIPLIQVSRFFLREGNGTPLQYSSLENPMDGGVW